MLEMATFTIALPARHSNGPIARSYTRGMPSSDDVTYDRVKLYEEVWAEPVRTVAKRYGVSDVALAKTAIVLFECCLHRYGAMATVL